MRTDPQGSEQGNAEGQPAARTCGADCATRGADPVGALNDHSSDCDLRLVCRDGALAANRCVLCRASSVLRETLRLQLATPGELPLPDDDAGTWAVVLKLLNLESYPLQLVTMENVTPLLVLSDKYDIPVVRGACAHFLHIRAPSMRLSEPLASPANTLTAATLMYQYASTHPSLQPYCTAVQARLDDELSPLTRRPPATAGVVGSMEQLSWQADLSVLVSRLEAVVATEEYVTRVAAEVQLKVSRAMLTALRHLALRPPLTCQHCHGLMNASAEAFHAHCATTHFTSLHTKGCRLCGVAMPPSHARFCNTCAYRRHK